MPAIGGPPVSKLGVEDVMDSSFKLPIDGNGTDPLTTKHAELFPYPGTSLRSQKLERVGKLNWIVQTDPQRTCQHSKGTVQGKQPIPSLVISWHLKSPCAVYQQVQESSHRALSPFLSCSAQYGILKRTFGAHKNPFYCAVGKT